MSTYYKNERVKVNDRFEINGTPYVAIEAVKGKPFMGGDTYPVKTQFATVPESDLHITEKVGE